MDVFKNQKLYVNNIDNGTIQLSTNKINVSKHFIQCVSSSGVPIVRYRRRKVGYTFDVAKLDIDHGKLNIDGAW